MTNKKVEFGLLLPNRGVIIGDHTVSELIELTVRAEESGYFDSVWVGDSILAKPRLESISLLSALASRTERVKLGPACFASFPLRHAIVLAYQWASLDVITDGRTIMAACLGGGSRHYGGEFDREYQAMHREYKQRVSLLEEGIEVLRKVWTEDNASYSGQHYEFQDITVEPKPVQDPHPPIWIANNPHIFDADPKIVQRAFRRVAKMADGWMTAVAPLSEFKASRELLLELTEEEGRNPAEMTSCLLHCINIKSEVDEGIQDSTDFLNKYYMTNYTREEIENWGVFGPAEVIVEDIHAYIEAGADHIILRLATWDQLEQFEKCVEQIMPHVT
jgi:alkanesulfonate monooxygenase SsuD/methylene tetrahydromethanopterin reductase-like flavin-dependent oxidoreductase (luciferase family)